MNFVRVIQKFILPTLGTPTSKILHSILPDLIFQSYRRFSKDIYILSYPCCGRTWLRLLIGRSLQIHHGLSDELIYDLYKISYQFQHANLPRLIFEHDGNPHRKSANQLELSKKRFSGSKVILLVRDPRDVIVSWYFENIKRAHLAEGGFKPFDGDISEFVHEDIGGLDTIISYYNIWLEEQNAPDDFLLVRYEDISKNSVPELDRIFKFIGIDYLPEKTLEAAFEFTAFENMRKLEEENKLKVQEFRPGDDRDAESFKTRKGIVGGYQDYLNAESVNYIDDRIAKNLSPKFGY